MHANNVPTKIFSRPSYLKRFQTANKPSVLNQINSETHDYPNREDYDKITTLETLETQDEGLIVFPSSGHMDIQSTENRHFNKSVTTDQQPTISATIHNNEGDFHLDTASFIPR